MWRRRRSAGLTGHPDRQVEGTSAAVMADTVPTNAGAAAEVGGGVPDSGCGEGVLVVVALVVFVVLVTAVALVLATDTCRAEGGAEEQLARVSPEAASAAI